MVIGVLQVRYRCVISGIIGGYECVLQVCYKYVMSGYTCVISLL